MNKRRAIQLTALLCALFLTAAAPLVYAAEELELTDSELRAVNMIFQAYDAVDAKEQETLLLQAVQTAPDSPFVLLECANLLSELNTNGALTETIEAILKKAKSVAAGALLDQAFRLLGDFYLKTRGIDAARIFIEEELAEAPNELTLRIMLAKIYYYSEEIHTALSMLEEILEDSPQALEAAELRASLLLDLKRWDEALEAFSQIEKGFPNHPESLSGRHVAFVATGQFDLAVRAINEEIFHTANENLWMERLSVRVYHQKDPVAALSEADALIKAHPGWVDVYFAKMNAQIMMAQYDDAIVTAREVAKIDAPLSQLLESLALLACSRWDEAKALMLPALQTPYLKRWWADAAILFMQGYDDIDSATEAVIQSFAAENNNFDSFLRLGDLNAYVGNPLEAARCYYHAELYADDDARAMQMLVTTLVDAGRREESAKYLKIMEERYPGWYETMTARVFYEHGYGTPEAALRFFVDLKEKFPFPAASLLQPLEAVLLLANGDEKGEWLIDEWMNRKDSESLTAADWLLYAEALLYTENIEKSNDVLDMTESCLKGTGAARVNNRQYEALLASYRAEAARRMGDMDSCVEWLTKACALGATLASDTLETPDGNPYPSEAYDELYRQYELDLEPWDVTVYPIVPK